MNAVKMISWIHLVWGLSLILIGIQSRPFGQLEAFLFIADKFDADYFWVGLLFATSGAVSIVSLFFIVKFYTRPILLPLMLLPQQFILIASLTFAIADGIRSHGLDDRIWYAGVTQAFFAWFHARGMYDLYKVALIDRTIKAERKNGNTGR